MITQDQAFDVLGKILRHKDTLLDIARLRKFINEHPDPEPPKPTVDEMLEVLDVNMPYLREEMEAVFQVYYGIPVYVTVS